MRLLRVTPRGPDYLDDSNPARPLLVEVFEDEGSALRIDVELAVSSELESRLVRRAIERRSLSGKPALWSSFFAGETLFQAFAGHRATAEECLRIGIQIAQALTALHDAQWVHSALTPDCVRIDPEHRNIELSGLGSAFRSGSPLEELRSSGGTPQRYQPPEQLGRVSRAVDHRSDLYALGALMYELLLGRPLFDATSALELTHLILGVEPTCPREIEPTVPSALSAIIRKLLAKNPDERYHSARGLRSDLERCLDGLDGLHSTSGFILGGADSRGRKEAGAKLYGRDIERQRLLEAFERTTRGSVEWVLIEGASGTGKSALARELEREVTARGGRFIAGKFDVLMRSNPFSALSTAFETWVHLLLSEDERALARSRARIHEAIGDLGSLLTQLVPDLSLVIGPQPELLELGPSEALHRFEYVLARFAQAIVDPSCPLVLFVDDLQWADPASLSVLRALLRSDAASHLMLIATQRDDGADQSPSVIEDTLPSVRVSRLPLGPLHNDALEALLGDALGRQGEEVRALAAEMKERTGGNPLHVAQLLQTFEQTGALPRAEGGARTSNVEDLVSLLGRRIARLPDDLRRTLAAAAALGNRFAARQLASATQTALAELEPLLEHACAEGLLLRLGSRETSSGPSSQFEFPHDRYQQALYSSVPLEERAALHSVLATGLFRARERGEDVSIFDLAEQLHRAGGDCMRPERPQIEMDAGLLAKRSAAYRAALEYFERALASSLALGGRELLELEVACRIEAAEAAYLCGALDRMEDHTENVLRLGRGILETIRLHNLRVDAYTSQNRLGDALAAGRVALARLGVEFPAAPGMPHILLGLARTKLLLSMVDVERLPKQRVMTDPEKREAMLLLERMVPPAYMSGNALFPLLVFAMVELSVRYGNSPLSPFGYGSFAITLAGVLGDIRGGERFGNVARSTMEELRADAFLVKIYFVLYVFIEHWTKPLVSCCEPLLLAYRSGMKVGNLVGSTWSAYYRLLWYFYSGRSLPSLEREAAEFSATFEQLKQQAAWRRCEMLRQTMLNLMGRSKDRVDFCGETYADAEYETLSATGDDATSRFFWHSNKVMLGYLFDRNESALEHVSRAQPFRDAVTSLPDVPLFEFWSALVRIRASERRRGQEQRSLLAAARKSATQLARWASFGPANHAHKHQLVAAELARVSGRTSQARELYDRAIEEALRNGFEQEAALACELAGLFHRRAGSQELARWYLGRARDGYARWGAFAKVEDLEHKMPELVERAAVLLESRNAADLDIASVVKATTAITSELTLDGLGAKLLAIAVENAGAQRGALVLTEVGEARVVARRDVSGRSTVDFEVPSSVIQYVTRTKRVLLVQDARSEGRFSSDPVVMHRGVRSILSAPIVHQGDLRAIVYLENNLVPGAFTEERIALLEVLGGPIAISLEHAKLYRNLEDSLARQTELTRAYSRFTPRAFLELLGKESILDVELGDHRRGDMTVLFSDIRGYTTLSEAMSTDDNFGFINGFLRRITPPISDHGGVVSDFVGDGVMSFFPQKPEDALRASVAMQRAVALYNRERRAKGRVPIEIGIGIHTGALMIGVIGDGERLDTALVSDVVNTAARLEGLTKEFRAPILVSEDTVSRLPDRGREFSLRRIGDAQVKGKSSSVRVIECFDADPTALRRAKSGSRTQFECAVDAFEAGHIDEARSAFAALSEAAGSADRTALRYLERCAEIRAPRQDSSRRASESRQFQK